MSEPFLQSLKDEILSLESELNNDPRFKKLESLRNVLAIYDASGGGKTISRQPSVERSEVLNLARLFLRNRSGPTPTRIIYTHITKNGGKLNGKDPVSSLSALLSNSEEFESSGRKGWTLKYVANKDDQMGKQHTSDGINENSAAGQDFVRNVDDEIPF